MFLRTESELALTGRRCIPARLLDGEFVFGHVDLDEALRDILA